MNYKRKSRRWFFLLMRSRTPPISLEFRGGFEPPKPPPRYATAFDWTVCCHGSPILLRRDVCRNTKSAPGSNTAPRRWLVLGSITCTYHARQTLNVYSRTMQRLCPRCTNSIIYASINIRAAHSSLHSFNVRIHSTFIYSLAQLLSSRFCVMNFISDSTLLAV